MKQNRGLFITLEGGEGAGKTTLIEGLFEVLVKRGLDVIKTREPGGSSLGKEIRTLLLHSEHVSARAELLLFLADRAEHVEYLIAPALNEGKVVLCDRYNDSTLAYQGGGRELKLEGLCHFATGNLNPDLTLYLDIEPEIGLMRAGTDLDRLEKEGIAFHQKVRSAFQALAEAHPERIVTLDAKRTPAEILNLALETIYAKLKVASCPM